MGVEFVMAMVGRGGRRGGEIEGRDEVHGGACRGPRGGGGRGGGVVEGVRL